jgi:hypothetical protein
MSPTSYQAAPPRKLTIAERGALVKLEEDPSVGANRRNHGLGLAKRGGALLRFIPGSSPGTRLDGHSVNSFDNERSESLP